MNYSHSPSQVDPFYYAMPSRNNLMSLSTINASDNMKTTTKKFLTERNQSQNLYVNDITGNYLECIMFTFHFIGASPKLHGSRQFNTPGYSHQNWDIDRSYPASLHITLNKPSLNLTSKDIEGAAPNCVKFLTKRTGHPLNP